MILPVARIYSLEFPFLFLCCFNITIFPLFLRLLFFCRKEYFCTASPIFLKDEQPYLLNVLQTQKRRHIRYVYKYSLVYVEVLFFNFSVFIRLKFSTFWVGANSRLGAKSNKYGTFP